MNVKILYSIILAMFPLLSLEILSWEMILVIEALILISSKFHLPKVIIYLVIFGCSYYLKKLFGVFYIPESMITFLALMCLLRILTGSYQQKSNRILIFLWMGCFLLFKSDLLGILFFAISSIIILKTLNHEEHLKVRLNDLFNISNLKIKETIIGFLCIFALFVFFPRIYGFLPGVRNQQTAKIGYSKEVNNSQAENLQPSSQVAFIAQIKPLPQEQLYWRGRVHTLTDGYNWRTKDLISRNHQTIQKQSVDLIKYNIKYEQNFFGDIIMLDIPYNILETNLGIYRNKESATFASYMKDKKLFISGESILDQSFLEFDPKNIDSYLQIPPITKTTLLPIKKYISNPLDLNSVILDFQNYLQINEYSYNLRAPNSNTLKDFIENKQGFCTHYASLFGLLLRDLGFPTRLVSGFQGGEYNSIGGHYLVSSNDAHTWVEVYNKKQKQWFRVDPTSFIAPNRIIQGGEAFLLGKSIESNNQEQSQFMKLYYNTKQYWDNLNFKVSLFLDTFDRDKQEQLGLKFNLKRSAFILIGFLLILCLFLIIYFLKNNDKKSKNEVDNIFDQFVIKMEKLGISINKQDSLNQIQNKILQQSNIEHDLFLQFLNCYEKNKYSKTKSIETLKGILKTI